MIIDSAGRSWDYGMTMFSLVRDALATACGIEDRKEYYRHRFTDDSLMGFWHNESTHYVGEGFEEPLDDIDYLMLHQDCEGIFLPWTSALVAARMKDIIAHAEPGAFDSWFRVREATIELMDFLERAGEEGILVEFSG